MSNNLKKGVLSSVLLVVDSIAKKLVGLISTLILARVLAPEDFGIIAIATLMVGFIQILSNTGSQQYLLRVETADLAAYKKFHTDRLGTVPHVRSITSYMVMGSPKDMRA